METKNVNKNSLVCLIIVIFLFFWPLELRKKHGNPLVFKPDFYIFSYNEQLTKI